MKLYEHIKQPPPAVPYANTFGPPPPVPIVPTVNKQLSIFEQTGYMYQDLYPFSQQDSNLWLELFIIADKVNPDMAHRLEYIRATGAWLVPDNEFGYVIKPIIDPSGTNGWSSMEQYLKERQCLDPYIKQIIEALKELRNRFNSGLILNNA
jgi:hypothetical protein